MPVSAACAKKLAGSGNSSKFHQLLYSPMTGGYGVVNFNVIARVANV